MDSGIWIWIWIQAERWRLIDRFRDHTNSAALKRYSVSRSGFCSAWESRRTLFITGCGDVR